MMTHWCVGGVRPVCRGDFVGGFLYSGRRIPDRQLTRHRSPRSSPGLNLFELPDYQYNGSWHSLAASALPCHFLFRSGLMTSFICCAVYLFGCALFLSALYRINYRSGAGLLTEICQNSSLTSATRNEELCLRIMRRHRRNQKVLSPAIDHAAGTRVSAVRLAPSGVSVPAFHHRVIAFGPLLIGFQRDNQSGSVTTGITGRLPSTGSASQKPAGGPRRYGFGQQYVVVIADRGMRHQRK